MNKYNFYKHPIRNLCLKLNYYVGNYKDKIWIIGDGRSGTTWLSEILSNVNNYREMFEPFHPMLPYMKNFIPNIYMRPNKDWPWLEDRIYNVFNGKFINDRVDDGNKINFYSGLLVKDIFANLFAYWAYQCLKDIKIILIIRNPFAVALSKLKAHKAYWFNDPLLLFNQHDLYKDYLYKYNELLENVLKRNDDLQKQILFWSIINYIPLSQFANKNIYIVCYEDIYQHPYATLNSIASYFSLEPISNMQYNIFNEPSKSTGKTGNMSKGISPIIAWKNQLSTKQIDYGFSIINKFNLIDYVSS